MIEREYHKTFRERMSERPITKDENNKEISQTKLYEGQC